MSFFLLLFHFVRYRSHPFFEWCVALLPPLQAQMEKTGFILAHLTSQGRVPLLGLNDVIAAVLRGWSSHKVGWLLLQTFYQCRLAASPNTGQPSNQSAFRAGGFQRCAWTDLTFRPIEVPRGVRGICKVFVIYCIDHLLVIQILLKYFCSCCKSTRD